jgi:hypothetical protein
MPLKKNARLGRAARIKIRQILRRFYQQLLTRRIPDRLSAMVTTARGREPPDQPAKPRSKPST